MSGDSSSEDNIEQFKEAVDSDFLTENLYTNGKLKENSKSPKKLTPSLRNQNQQELSTNPFSVKVTPEFQKHVSKHLTKLLDELIDDYKIKKETNSGVKKHLNSGIKLLASSKDFLVSDSKIKTNVKESVKRKFKKNDLDEREYEKRAKEVAVTPEWVLSQEETKYWTSNKKDICEIVKLNGNCSTLKSQLKKT